MILAAGGGRRMGGPKALLAWGDLSWAAAHAQRLATCARVVVVVVGAEAERVAASLPPGVVVVPNPRWATTHPADSARLALAAVPPGASRVLVTPVDVPVAEPAWLEALALAPAPAVPVTPSGRPGHPVVLSAAELRRLATEPLPDGLRGLLVGATEVPVPDDRVALDADTPEDLPALRR